MKRFKASKYKKFSQANVDYLCHEVQRMEESQLFYPADFIEALRELAEVIIWSDKNVDPLFDSFLEKNMMSTFERVVTNAEFPSLVKVQAIQSITMMLQNLTRKSSIYYVCSNNHLNRIISIALDENDEELFTMYVSFLKTLALRLNEDTVQFFFERETGAFPLFDRAAKLLDASDRMVRAAARQIVISVAQLTDSAIILFLETALKDVFKLISQVLWVQIKNLGEVSMEYGNMERDENSNSNSSSSTIIPLLSISAFSDRLEDIVDDLFYINDLFSVPHSFVARTLEEILDSVVIIPLLKSVETSSKNSYFTFSSSLSSTSFEFNNNNNVSINCVPVSTALCVLTRWILVNKVERLQIIFQERLINYNNKNGGLLVYILQHGCMQGISGAVVLLEAMVKSKLVIIQNEKYIDTKKEMNKEENGENIELSKEDEKENKNKNKNGGELLLKDILNESWNIDELDDETLPPLEPWVTPTCEVFVNRMCKCIKNNKIKLWCKGLTSALYYFITRSTFTRLSVFDLAISLLMNFIHQPKEQGIFLKGLLFLSLVVVRRRAISYAEYLASRKKIIITNSSNDSSSTSTFTNVNSGGDWLRTPYEILFIKLENVCREFNVVKHNLSEDLTKEVSLLLPLLPNWDFLRMELSKHNNNNNNNSTISENWKAILREPLRYATLQKNISTIVSYRNRAAHDKSEEERNEFLIWMSIRHYIFKIFYTRDKHNSQEKEKEEIIDSFLLKIRSYAVRHPAGSNIYISSSTKMCFRCEFVKERFICSDNNNNNSGPQPTRVAAGTPMYMILNDTEALFISSNKIEENNKKELVMNPSNINNNNTSVHRVIFALQIIYIQAVVSHAPFCVIITHAHPSSPMQIYIVFRHRHAATAAVEMINKLSSLTRRCGAVLLYHALHPTQKQSLSSVNSSEVLTTEGDEGS